MGSWQYSDHNLRNWRLDLECNGLKSAIVLRVWVWESIPFFAGLCVVNFKLLVATGSYVTEGRTLGWFFRCVGWSRQHALVAYPFEQKLLRYDGTRGFRSQLGTSTEHGIEERDIVSITWSLNVHTFIGTFDRTEVIKSTEPITGDTKILVSTSSESFVLDSAPVRLQGSKCHLLDNEWQ